MPFTTYRWRGRILRRYVKYKLRTSGPCKHCGNHQTNRPRGLCYTCYHTPAVRAKYPTLSGTNGPGVECHGGYDLPTEPTTAPPGSAEKIAVLARRAKQKRSLWHPQDRSER